VDSGHLRREGARLYVTDITDIDDRRRPCIRPSPQELAKLAAIQSPDDDTFQGVANAILGRRKTIRLTTAEMLNAVTAALPRRAPPLEVPSPQPPKQPGTLDGEHSVFKFAPLAWQVLAGQLPEEAHEWAYKAFWSAVDAGNPVENCYRSVLEVDLPQWRRDRLFAELRRLRPGIRREVYDAWLGAGLSPEQVLDQFRRAVADQAAEQTAGRQAELAQRPEAQAAQPTRRRPREVADLNSWRRAEEEDLQRCLQGKTYDA
jgi:hypothetical protein